MAWDFISVGIGGFIGSCLRFLFTKISAYLGFAYPFGTLASNIIASLFIGFIIGLEQHVIPIPPRTRLFLTTGILGGLSTFSTFSLETVNFFTKGNYFLALGNILINLVPSLLCVLIGMYLARVFFAKV